MIHQFSLKVCDRVGRAPWRTHPESWILSPAHMLSHTFFVPDLSKNKDKKNTKTKTNPRVLTQLFCVLAQTCSHYLCQFGRKTKTNSLKVKVPRCAQFQLGPCTSFHQFLRHFYPHYRGVLSTFCATFAKMRSVSSFHQFSWILPHILVLPMYGDVLWAFITATSIYSNYSGW